ncbi:FAD/NAD-P-binding domain-containing protein [Irpex rosettiformis]|uniref:FAD/NAD-P-binding domain-containing protein n=1 Tax=Irpex rosettiformis TaxID=378272 RepID=A0ACB8UAQ3_9APHY|nr:FAD/NAD-P-binding domain-containing protein [Irpex rosettiformis]
MSPTADQVASLSLEFLIVGGGIGGFSAAYMLAKGGHKVRVLERQSRVGTPAAGLRVPPNMSKILKRWIGEEELQKNAVVNLETPWYDLHTGELYGSSPWRQDVMNETGGDFLLMAHSDVHRIVYQLAIEAGVRIDFGAKVTEVSPGDPRPSVTLANGEVVTADVVVGADGPRSIVRPVVVGEEEDDPEPEGVTVFGATVPASWMETDPQLSKMIKQSAWPLIVGTNRSICAHPIRNYKQFSLMIHWPDEEAGTPENAMESWYDVVPTKTLDYSTLAPVWQKMMKGVSCLWRTRSMLRPEAEYWVDESERIVLMGEAAHPAYAGCSHGASMAIEDAVVLGKLFSFLSSPAQIPNFLHAFEEIRQQRVKDVRIREASNAAFVRMPPGPEQDARNTHFRMARGEWDDGALKTEFEGLAVLFGYDAYDAAAEWWVEWGQFQGKTNEPRNEMQFSFASVASVVEHEVVRHEVQA